MSNHISPYPHYDKPLPSEEEQLARVKSFAADFGKCEWRARQAGLTLIQNSEDKYSILGITLDGKRKWAKRIYPRLTKITGDRLYRPGPYIYMPECNFTLPEIVGSIIAKIEKRKGRQA